MRAQQHYKNNNYDDTQNSIKNAIEVFAEKSSECPLEITAKAYFLLGTIIINNIMRL